MSLRILHILDHSVPLQSGYAFRTLSLLREQRALGWQTFHLTTPKHYAPGPEEEEIGGLRFLRTRLRPAVIARVPVINQAAVILATSRRIEELIPRIRPDVIHAHSPALNGIAALRAARKHGLPVVYEMRASWEDAAVDHGTTREGSLRYRVSRWLETSVLRHANAVTTICEGLAKEIRSRGVPAERVTVIPNAVDIEDFELIKEPDTVLRRSLGLGEGPVLGFIGSLYGYEGLELLIRALPAIARIHRGARIVLVGGGPAEGALKRLAAELGLAEHVRFLGRVPHGEVQRFYSIVDLLVYPRLSIRLTELVTPLKPLEAMSLGRLYVASDVGGHRELVPSMLRPFLFRPGDAADLARKALELLAQRDRWPALSAGARRYVAEQRTWRRSVAGYIDVYANQSP
ncbi:MAG: TIGR04063 family PEP-CTERM/XrtA system glycosyltransferase [Steroidobacteraceae bacterium]